MADELVLAVAQGPQFLSTELPECPPGLAVGFPKNE